MRRSESCSTLQLLLKFLRNIKGLIFLPQGKKLWIIVDSKAYIALAILQRKLTVS